MDMNRIVIIGSPGAGKSTLARKLGEKLNIEVIHLDRAFWYSGWREYPREIRLEIQRKLIEKDRWIIEGSYLSTSNLRLNAADTIIFLDTPRLICLYRVIKRRFLDSKRPRPDLPEGCKERISIPYFLKVLVFPHRGRRLLLSLLQGIHEREQRLADKERKKIRAFVSQREVDAFVESIPPQPQSVSTSCYGQTTSELERAVLVPADVLA